MIETGCSNLEPDEEIAIFFQGGALVTPGFRLDAERIVRQTRDRISGKQAAIGPGRPEKFRLVVPGGTDLSGPCQIDEMRRVIVPACMLMPCVIDGMK